MGKTDSTGTYSYFCDGASPGSPVLSDGHAVYTPGLSENRGVSRYYSNDRLGNLWTLDGSSKGQLFYQDFAGFGGVTAQSGTGSVFGYGGGNGCQTEADTGLVLMGHRYYDTRIGRFISQDPAGAGSNWYVYAYNNPMNRIDPLGLDTPPDAAFGDFGLGADQAYAAEPINSARAGLTAQMNQSAGLIAQFQYYSVDKVTFYTDTKMIISTEHLFDFAVPIGTSIYGNLAAARDFGNQPDRHGLSIFESTVNHLFRDVDYVNNHFKNKTVGDYKDKNFPGIGQPRIGTRLYDLADNGGNMNGGMSMGGLGMNSWEIGLSGTVHRSIMNGGYTPDDAMGAAVLQVGFNYGKQIP